MSNRLGQNSSWLLGPAPWQENIGKQCKFVDDGVEKVGIIISAWNLKHFNQRCYTIRIPSDGREFERIYSLDISKVDLID
jgi:hypothetical protein